MTPAFRRLAITSCIVALAGCAGHLVNLEAADVVNELLRETVEADKR